MTHRDNERAGLARQYANAMSAGNTGACIRLEKENGLFGYPPELVSVGLRAIDQYRDPINAIEAYIEENME